MTEAKKAAEEWWILNRESVFSLTEAFSAGAAWQLEDLRKKYNFAYEMSPVLAPTGARGCDGCGKTWPDFKSWHDHNCEKR